MKNQVLIAALIAAAASVSDAFSVAPAARSSAPSVAGTISHHGDLRIASRSQFASKVVFEEGGSSAPFKNRRSHRGHRRVRAGLLHTLPQHEDAPLEVPSQDNDETFDVKTTATLIGGQSVLIVIAAAAAAILGTANLGLGLGFKLSVNACRAGAMATLPLFLLAYGLDFVEKGVPALQDVTKATQRSVLALLGRRRKPVAALVTSLALGAAAGPGEEMMFRGVLQSELANRLGDGFAIASSSLIFGALHAVTPLYAALATLASLYFGFLYQSSQNLAIPIICHGVYDVGALIWAHWTVTAMSSDEQTEIINWIGPQDRKGDVDA